MRSHHTLCGSSYVLGCRCEQHRPRTIGSLSEIAPRLARARDQRVARLRYEAAERARYRRLSLKAERLIAHRELQLVRAYATGDGRYIAARQRKLAAARRELAAVEERAA